MTSAEKVIGKAKAQPTLGTRTSDRPLMTGINQLGGAEPVSLRSVILGILRHEEFADTLVEAIDAHLPREMTADTRDQARHAVLCNMVRRVVRNVQTHPRRHALVCLMRDSDIASDEAFMALEFVYSCVINHFKGELAELLAHPLLSDFASHLVTNNLSPPGVQFIPGHAFTTPRNEGQKTQYKSADAILTVTTDQWADWNSKGHALPAGHLVLVAAAEIKAYRQSLRKTFGQLAAQVGRFRFGMCMSGTTLDPAEVFLAIGNKRGSMDCVPCLAPYPAERFARLVIRPSLKTRPQCSLDEWGSHAWMSELPFTSHELLEAAFRFAIWFVTQMATDSFEVAGLSDGTCPPTLSIPANIGGLQDRFLEALYHFGRRESFQEKSRKHRRIANTFFWLYNSLCYGRQRARGDRLQCPEEHPNLPRSYPVERKTRAAQFLSDSWGAYARGELRDALAILEKACEAGIRRTHAYRVAWLEGMIAYCEGHFEDAIRCFPGAEPNTRYSSWPHGISSWWPRDQLMAARLRTRTGDNATARELLNTLTPPEQHPNRSFPVEYYGVSALTELLAGDKDGAQNDVDRGIEILETLRSECHERAEADLGQPTDIDVSAIHRGVFDLVAVLSATGRCAEAVHHLTCLSGFDGWELLYLSRDPLLAPLFGDKPRWPQLAVWLKREQAT